MNDNFETLALACKNGDLQSFKSGYTSLTTQQKKEFVTHNEYAAYHLAMASGNLPTLEEVTTAILQNFATDPMEEETILVTAFKARHGEGFITALEKHEADIIDFMLTEEFVSDLCVEIINQKIEHIQFIIQHPQLNRTISGLFQYACATDINTVKAWLNSLPKDNVFEMLIFDYDYGRPQETAWTCFHIIKDPAIIDLIWNSLPNAMRDAIAEKMFPRALIQAIKENRTQVVQKMLSLLKPEQRMLCFQFEDYNGFVYAADRGNYTIVKMLWDMFTEDTRIEALKASNYAAYRLAYKAGHQDITSFLETHASPSLLLEMKASIHKLPLI